jgi:hypothetical protein
MGRAPRSRIILGRTVLIWRLAGRDLRHRPAQALLLLLAITAATATLTLGLALHGVTSQPYQRTRAATRQSSSPSWPDLAHHGGGDREPGAIQASGSRSPGVPVP